MPKVIGLTGGIAMGKSNVSDYLAELGMEVIDADAIVHSLQERGTDCYQTLVAFFGKQILNSTLDINRKKLGEIVFNNPNNLKQLVLLMDPYIRKTILSKIKMTKKPIVILDAPTLFENGYQYLTDQIMVVRCDPIVQMQRLRERNHLSYSQASKRIANQWPIDIKVALADVVIDSDGSISQTRQQVLKWWNEYSKLVR